MEEKNYQSRKFLLTINNPEIHGCSHSYINGVLSEIHIDYYCMSDERGIDKGTKHTHIFIYSMNPVRFSTLKRRFEYAHIDRCKGSCLENRAYVLKEGKWAETEKAETTIEGSFEEHGILPSERAEKEPDMACIISMFDDGYTVNDVLNIFPKYALRVNELESLYNLRRINSGETLRNVKVTYLYGDTGTGKTYSVYKKYRASDVCRITNYRDRGLFDGYHGQRIMVLDEFHSQIPLPQMLTYLDVYPVSLPARYHDRQAVYNEVYILSNLPYEKQYEMERLTDYKTWQAFDRRINTIIKQIGYDQTIEISKGDIYYDETPFNH